MCTLHCLACCLISHEMVAQGLHYTHSSHEGNVLTETDRNWFSLFSLLHSDWLFVICYITSNCPLGHSPIIFKVSAQLQQTEPTYCQCTNSCWSWWLSCCLVAAWLRICQVRRRIKRLSGVTYLHCHEQFYIVMCVTVFWDENIKGNIYKLLEYTTSIVIFWSLLILR